MSKYSMMTQEEIMIEEEIIENMLTKLIHIYGFEHTKVRAFAWYVERCDLAECERVYKMLVA